jgi:hypothetical protein
MFLGFGLLFRARHLLRGLIREFSMISCDCENCGQPTNGWFFIMIQKADGTWIERVNGSDPEPGDLYCCYDCSEQLESHIVFAIDDDRILSRM